MSRCQVDDDEKKLSNYYEKYDCAFDRIGDKGLKTWGIQGNNEARKDDTQGIEFSLNN